MSKTFPCKTTPRTMWGGLLLACALLLPALDAHAMRLKEIASVQGVRSNHLSGYGLVFGLDGTGDQTGQMPYTRQALENQLEQMGITLPGNARALQAKNVAAVMVTAELPAFARPGQSIDVTVSSMGNARSLKGGTLVATPLRGADGEIYALAQGNVIVGGAGAAAAGSKVQINHLSAGRIAGGAQVERAVATPLGEGGHITLDLKSTDFQSADRVARSINAHFGPGRARALDGRTVQVDAPQDVAARVRMMAEMEELDIERSAPGARVVLNARTGSIVLNEAVTLGPCAVAHGNLSITIGATPVISQPGALSQGQTVVAQQASIQVNQDGGNIISMPASAQLSDVVQALNTLGATPQDLLAILQAMQAAGALHAELEVL